MGYYSGLVGLFVLLYFCRYKYVERGALGNRTESRDGSSARSSAQSQNVKSQNAKIAKVIPYAHASQNHKIIEDDDKRRADSNSEAETEHETTSQQQQQQQQQGCKLLLLYTVLADASAVCNNKSYDDDYDDADDEA